MAIDNVHDDAGGSELYSKVDEAHAYNDWNGPGILCVERLTPGKESRGCQGKVGDVDGKAELRF
jgi:hypothetical protein